jgi:hypothetical protein
VEQRTGGIVTSVRRTYFTPDDKEVAVEELTLEDGHIKTFTLDQRQVNEQGKLEVSGGKLTFTYTSGGQTTTDSEPATPELMVSPALVPFLQARWETLLSGETVKARLAALERKETVGFQFTKIGEETRDGRTVVSVQMKPSSFIIAALVKPIRLDFDKETRRIVEYSGRALPKKLVDGKWENFEATAVYTY